MKKLNLECEKYIDEYLKEYSPYKENGVTKMGAYYKDQCYYIKQLKMKNI